MSTETTANGWHPSVNPWIIAGAVVLAAFIEVLDTTIVSVALPYMAGSLSSTTDEATWVLTSYLVANAIILPASGWFSLRFGRKRFLMACTAIFIVASFLCGIAPSMGFLVFARIMQGLGGGALQPVTQAVLLEAFPREKRGMAMAAFGLAIVVAPVIGPTLGGWLTDNYSWRWVFNINVPIGIVALYLMGRYLEDPPYVRDAKVGKIDSIGFGLLAVWLATFQIVLDKGQTEDWFAASWIVWFSVISAVSMITLIWWELRNPDPIVDLRVFKDRNFWVGTLIITVISAAMYGSLTTMPLFLQNLMGYTSEASGWATAPRGIGSMLTMPLVGYLLSKMDGRWITAAGIACFGAATVALSKLTLDASPAAIGWPNGWQGACIGMIFVPIMAISMATLPNEKIGNASGIFNLMRNLAGSIGISITTTYVTRFSQAYQSQMVGHLTPYDPAYQQFIARMGGDMMGSGGVSQQAHGFAYQVLQQQSAYQAFMAVFGWSAVISTALLFTPFIMKKVKTSGGLAVH
jgi:DHA2 family multidrug resistance protein